MFKSSPRLSKQVDYLLNLVSVYLRIYIYYKDCASNNSSVAQRLRWPILVQLLRVRFPQTSTFCSMCRLFARTTGYDQGLTLSVNGQKVKKADKVKFLEVIIDENLTWDDQIKHLENKLLATIVLIKRVKKFIPSSHYLKIYQSLFVSHLTYGISCWGGVYDSKLEKLFKIQERCIRILFGESYSFDHPEYYATCCRTKT